MNKINTLQLGFANAFVIQEQGKMLVDTGINVTGEKYLKLFSDLDVDPRAIQLIVITHGHLDHFGHAQELKELTGAPLLCHKAALASLRTGINPEIKARNQLGESMLRKIRLPQLTSYQPVEPDILVDAEFDLKPYGIAGKIIPIPGHSDCSIAVVLASGEALVGDLVVASPFTGKPCLAYLATDEDALFASVEKLLSRVHTFYGAHGGPFSREEVVQAYQKAKEASAKLRLNNC